MAHESFLVVQFRELYAEIIRWKRRVERDPRTFREALPGEAAAGVAPSEVWQGLLETLERQGVSVRRGGGEYASELFREAQYVMAALADEVFLHLDWPGRESWKTNLLEQKLFGTHRAGEAVFQRIDRILRSRDPVEIEIAKVYLMALGLGFQGRFRGADTSARLDAYRRQLHAFVTNQDPDAPRAPKPLFPEAYAGGIDAGESRRLPPVRRWALAAVLLALAWIALSQHLWQGLTADLAPLVRRILDQPADLRAPGGPPSTS